MANIAVAGATGLVGREVVAALREGGHKPVEISRATGVDVVTGTGLDRALSGVSAVVDVLNRPAQDAAEAVAFFQTTTRNLLDAEHRAGVGHHVLLSIVNIDRFEGSAHYAGKRAQERVVETGPVPWTIQRATQFHDFAGMVAEPDPIGTGWRSCRRCWSSRSRSPTSRRCWSSSPPARRGAGRRTWPDRRPQDLVDMARRTLAARGDPDPAARQLARRPVRGRLGRRGPAARRRSPARPDHVRHLAPGAAGMRRVLVTGVSAVGKSTAVGELARRGVKAVDLDDPTWSEWVDSPDGDGPSPLHPGQDWLWREDRVARLLATEDADVLVVGGCAPNLGTFRDRFDVIVLLSAPAAVMASRLGEPGRIRVRDAPGGAGPKPALQGDGRAQTALHRPRRDRRHRPPRRRRHRPPHPCEGGPMTAPVVRAAEAGDLDGAAGGVPAGVAAQRGGPGGAAGASRGAGVVGRGDRRRAGTGGGRGRDGRGLRHHGADRRRPRTGGPVRRAGPDAPRDGPAARRGPARPGPRGGRRARVGDREPARDGVLHRGRLRAGRHRADDVRIRAAAAPRRSRISLASGRARG